MVKGLPPITHVHACEGCSSGKQTRNLFSIGGGRRANLVLELVHADLCGPMQTKTVGGNLYFFLLTDDYTRYSWVYFLQSKDQTLEFLRSSKL